MHLLLLDSNLLRHLVDNSSTSMFFPSFLSVLLLLALHVRVLPDLHPLCDHRDDHNHPDHHPDHHDHHPGRLDHPAVKESDSDTVIMVIVLVVGVGFIFMLFAVMALCYR